MFCELHDGLISASGADAATFLQSQLTSDVLSLSTSRTQYSGYCSPKGRLLATFLVWRREDEFLLELPAVLATPVRTRLAKYVLRSRVTLSDASARFRMYGIAGDGFEIGAARVAGGTPRDVHDVVSRDGAAITRLALGRLLMMVSAEAAEGIDEALRNASTAGSTGEWLRTDIDAGVPWISAETEDRFVPQMVNLDLIGGVSYQKGCYPGQEIVARTHYLGRLKQRMYRIRLSSSTTPRAGDALFANEFGADQSCGTLINVATAGENSYEALAVVQIGAARTGAVHWGAIDGPDVEFLALPYPLPA